MATIDFDLSKEAEEILTTGFDNNILRFMYAVSVHIKESIPIDYIHGSKLFERIFNGDEEYGYLSNIMFNIDIIQKNGKDITISLSGSNIILSATLQENSLGDYGKFLLLILEETDTNILKVKDIPIRREIVEYIIKNGLGEIVYEE